MRLPSLSATSLLGALSLAASSQAVTIYTTVTSQGTNTAPTLPTNTNTATGPAYTGYTAYNLTTLEAPALPSPLPSLEYGVYMYQGGVNGMSIKQKGSFFGYSIELSVANQFLGRNSSKINVPFLNYVSNIRARIGQGMTIRVGGNSQEHTGLYLTPFPDYEIINKTVEATATDPTATPEVDIDIDLLYMLNNISNFLDTHWYLGLPFAYPLNITGISEMTGIFEQVLGDRLIALQLGNEPDLYGQQYRERPFDYWIPQYIDEWQEVMPSIANNSMVTRQNILLAPSICCNIPGNWSIQDLLDAGFLTEFKTYLAQLSVQHYPEDNCAGDDPPQAQAIFGNYLIHTYQTSGVEQYLTATATAVTADIPFMMFETNTASCAGFSGLSDSFGAALWAVDWAMQLAYSNFTGALFHFGGQNAAYNAFTPPPSNYSSDYQWTTGPIYYSNLMVAEALGSSNVSQVVDLDTGDYTPSYAIYENGVPMRALLINFMDDGGDGTAAVTGYVHIGGENGVTDTTPTTVTVRYLAAPSVSEKFNITWGGQSMGGGQFLSDGRLQGDVNTITVTCNTNTGCPIPIPAPGAALVFMSDTAETESYNTALTETFSTSVFKSGKNTGPTTDAAALETSNGRGGPQEMQIPLGATSHGTENDVSAGYRTAAVGMFTLGSVAFGAALIGRMLVR